jgi:hypothetical protein
MNKSELRLEWEQRIANFLSSGQSASKWCAANEVSIHQFWYWKKRCLSRKLSHFTFKKSYRAFAWWPLHKRLLLAN